MGDNKLNTAEYDSKGRCVRHPAIRLRKKKMLGGWKIIIGHCPECCLDEMRRVRDEIGAEQDGGDNHRGESGRREKKKKKKRSDRDRDRHRDRDRERDRGDRDRERRPHPSHSADNVSEVGSDAPPPRLGEMGHYVPNGGGRRGHPQHNPQSVAESEATGSTAPNSSTDGNGSVVSDPYIPRYQDQHHGGRAYHLQHPPPHHHQRHQQQYHHQQQQAPPPSQRTMVLSMAFTDPQTGQRGTYTGQVNSINHKPDGKGTVYYANGGIAEGSWMNGVLVENEDDLGPGGGYDQRGRDGRDGDYDGGGGPNMFPHPSQNRSRSASRGTRGDLPHGGGGGGGGPPQSRSLSTRGGRRGEGGVDPGSAAPFNGNLDRLDQLGGVRRARGPSRGASASVGSYRSAGSRGGGPSGSASVQNYVSGYGGVSVMSTGSREGVSGGGGYGDGGGGYNEYRRNDNGYQRVQSKAQSFHGRNPPGYR